MAEAAITAAAECPFEEAWSDEFNGTVPVRYVSSTCNRPTLEVCAATVGFRVQVINFTSNCHAGEIEELGENRAAAYGGAGYQGVR